MLRLLLPSFLLLSSFWLPPPASAESSQEIEALKKEIRELFSQGRRLAENNDFKSAIVKFFAALDLFKRLEETSISLGEKKKLQRSKTSFFYYLGRSYQLDKQKEKAFEYYLRCVKNDTKLRSQSGKACKKELGGLRSALLPDVQKKIETLVRGTPPPPNPRLPPPRPEVPNFGTLALRSSPQGVKVYKDNKLIVQLQSTQETLPLPPGSYVLSFRKEGYLPAEETIELQAGRTLSLAVELKPIPSPRRPLTPVPPKPDKRFEIALALGGGTGGSGYLQFSWRFASVFSLFLAGGASYGIADLDSSFAIRSLFRGFVGGGLRLAVGDSWRFLLYAAPGLGFGDGGLGFHLLTGTGVSYRFESGFLLGFSVDVRWSPSSVGSLLGLAGHLHLGYAF